MREITYKITDALGIHARPAGQLIKITKEYESDVKIEFNGKSVDAKRIFGVMGLAVKKEDEIKITISGADEDEAYLEIKTFLEENL